MKLNQVAIIGLGRFGSNLAVEFMRQGCEVLGIDKKAAAIEELEGVITHGVVGDANDEDILNSLGIRNFDCVVIAIGDDIQASIMTAILVKELGAKMVVAKAITEQHGRVLDKIGTDRVIYPEKDMAVRIVNQLVTPNLLDYIELSDNYTIAEIAVPENISGMSLRDMDIRAKFGCSIVALNKKKRHPKIIVSPSADDVLESGDVMVVIGTNKQVAKFEKAIDPE